MTVAWPNGASCALFPVVDAVDAEVPRVQATNVDWGLTLKERLSRMGVKLRFIRPGKPVGNAFAESFNGPAAG